MITGIGIDSIEIARVAQKCEDPRTRFAEKMFTPAERERAARKLHSPYEHLAACFAAREAFFKATQVWYTRAQVSVGQYESGEPYYILAPEIAEQLGSRRVLLSLTHDRTHATALCVCCDETGGKSGAEISLQSLVVPECEVYWDMAKDKKHDKKKDKKKGKKKGKK